MGVKFWVNKGIRETIDTRCYSNQNAIHICLKVSMKKIKYMYKMF